MKKTLILLKISGEALMGSGQCYNNTIIDQICEDVKIVYKMGYRVCLVVGGGNICRGVTTSKMGINRVSADQMGMIATIINSIALQSKLENVGLTAKVFSSIPIIGIVEQYIRNKALRYLTEGGIVIFSAGTANTFFTTDTGAVLRAIEMGCAMLLKGSKVDGVYSSDPNISSGALKYKYLSYDDVINNNITIMDNTAILLAKNNGMPIKIFNINKGGELLKVLQDKGEYTLIR